MRRKAVPVMTLLLVGSAIAAHVIPGVNAALIFDREAIGHGEWWRLVTGSWVHFSTAHLAYDGLAVLIAGWLLEREGAAVGWIALASASAVGLAVLLGMPTLARYAGLSGVAYALVTMVALLGLAERGTWRWLCLTTIALLGAKLAFETIGGRFLLVPTGGEVVPVPLSHAVGVVVAVIVYAIRRWLGRETNRAMRGAACPVAASGAGLPLDPLSSN